MVSQINRFQRCVFALLCVGIVSAMASADQILQMHNDSLTTYLKPTASNEQNVRPQVGQRGVHIDGTLRAPPLLPMACAGNPFGDSWNGNNSASGVRLDTGTYPIEDVDLVLPAPGFSWVIGRSYNARQEISGSHHDSNGYQGYNWFQMSAPEILLFEGNTDDLDVVYLIYGADRFLEFKRFDATSAEFHGVNGTAGAIAYAVGASSEPDTYTFIDQRGMQFVFFGFDSDSNPAKGQLWKVVDPAGNAAYAGDVSTGSTAISTGFNGDGWATTVYQGLAANATRRFTYDYTNGRLDSVTVAEKPSAGAFANTGDKVEYFYYGNEAHGEEGDLKAVKITTPLTDSGVTSVRWKYYRYYEGGDYNNETNAGYVHQIRYIYESEGVRQFDALDSNLADTMSDLDGATDATLKPYASASFSYYEDVSDVKRDRRIMSAWFNGSCGCGGGGAAGNHDFVYVAFDGIDDDAGYDQDEPWALRTQVELPGQAVVLNALYVWQYFDEVGQPLHRVMSEDDSPVVGDPIWRVVRNADGQVIEIDDPANIDTYVHDTDGDFAITSDASDGLVTLFTRMASGNAKGFIEYVKHQPGSGGTANLDLRNSYTTRDLVVGDVNLSRPFISWTHVYPDAETTDTDYLETSFAYTFHSGSTSNVLYLTPKQITTTLPAVSSAKNGSNASNTRKQYLRPDGTLAFGEAENGLFDYTQYSNGLVIKQIEDANTSLSYASGDDPNGDFGITEVNAGIHWTTEYAFDAQGRLDKTTLPGGRVLKHYYSRLGDGRLVTLSPSDFEATPKAYGPVQYSVLNFSGQPEVTATISLSGNESTAALTTYIDETDADAITAVDTGSSFGSVSQMTTSVYDKTGSRMTEHRLYHSIPGSSPGTEGTHYDATLYGYDESGRIQRTLDPTGTIRWTTYNSFGQPENQYVGTDDTGGSPFSGDMTSVTGSSYTVNLQMGTYTRVGAGYGGGLLPIGDGETEMTYDYRGRQIVRENATAPHQVFQYDNLNRVIGVGLYSSASGLNASSVPTSTTNRVGYTENLYDEMGRVWKTITHKIDASDGSSDDTLESLQWYDPIGRMIKIDGRELVKTRYDRLGRVTHRYVLSSDNDTANTYAHVYDATNKHVDVAGDIVLEEMQTTFDPADGNVVMSATMERFHSDYGGGETTGPLDTNADGDALQYTAANVEGRIQITANWYDRFDRLTDVVYFGTYNGATLDRDGLSVPSRSPTALLTEYTFNTDGTLLEIADPKNLKTRFAYDATGRQTLVINNYVNGTPSGVTGADDVHTRYGYTNGLMTKLHVDLDGEGDEDGADQVTTYTYGVDKTTSTPGPLSLIAAGHLLQQVTYPDGGIVSFAYGKQEQQVWMEDQNDTVIVTEYEPGRVGNRLVINIDDPDEVDDAVRRIQYTYDSLGRRATVTQYDGYDGYGVIVDQVKYTYDDWGPVSLIEQDRDSAVGGTGAIEYEVAYGYWKATTGRNTIRRISMTMPNTDPVEYVYYSVGGLHDDESSRVSAINWTDHLVVDDPVATTVASYVYNGVGTLVGTTYPEINVFCRRYSGAGSYPNLDEFNRVKTDAWTKDLSTDRDFYDLDIFYDENSNITRTEDNIFPAGKDVVYTMDGLNRLGDAQWGTYSGSLGSEVRQRTWTLDQVGNWQYDKLDLNNDNAYGGAGERNEEREHTVANEIYRRDVDDNGSWDMTLVYDDAGDLRDDDVEYLYVYDAFHRLRKVYVPRAEPKLVAEYRYNGLGHRIGWHYDVDADGNVEDTSDDPWFYFVYDDQWRIVATYRGSDSTPKEQFIYHAAGDDGFGGSSYIDATVLRDRDMTNGWAGTPNGSLEERAYYCQNWRADVVALVSGTGTQVQQVRYGEYGEAFGLPRGDTDGDGDVNNGDTVDSDQIQTWISAPAYDVRGDLDLDGDVDATDKTAAIAMAGTVLGWGTLSLAVSASNGGNRKGYAGYENDGVLSSSQIYHVRHRVYHAGLGRWMTYDPASYVDGPHLYLYCASSPHSHSDPQGLTGAIVAGAGMCFDVPVMSGVGAAVIAAGPAVAVCTVGALALGGVSLLTIAYGDAAALDDDWMRESIGTWYLHKKEQERIERCRKAKGACYTTARGRARNCANDRTLNKHCTFSKKDWCEQQHSNTFHDQCWMAYKACVEGTGNFTNPTLRCFDCRCLQMPEPDPSDPPTRIFP